MEKTASRMRVLVIIPAYNEQDSIMKVINDLRRDYPRADYVVINDCSRDRTKQVLRENKASYLDLPLNLGIGGGVQTGYRYALENGYDIAVQVDGDGQHDTAELGRMVELIEEGADIVIGSRFMEKEGFQSTAMRRAGIVFLSNLIRMVTGKRILDVTSGFRAVNRTYMELYAKDYPSDYPEPEAIVMALREGADIRETPVQMRGREYGKSSINFHKSIYYMIKVSLAICLCCLANTKRKDCVCI